MRDKYTENLILSSGKFMEEEHYWLQQLSGQPVMSGIPTESARVPLAQFKSAAVTRTLAPDVANKIKTLANGSPFAVYMILLTGVNYLLYRYTERTDLLVGMPVFVQKKTADSLNRIVAIRSRLQPSGSFRDHLLAVRSAVQEGSKHQNYPFERLAEQLELPVGDGLVPLFQTIVALESIHDLEMAKRIASDTLFAFSLEPESIRFNLIYNEHLYSRNLMEQVADHLVRAFAGMMHDVNQPLAEIDIYSEAENKRFLFDLNPSQADYPKDKSLPELFEAQAAKTPNAVAVVFEGEQLTYQELNEKANQVAWHLRGKGAGENTLVGIMAERSMELIIGILGILKAGAAYVPIDADYPPERIKYLLEHSQSALLLTRAEVPADLKTTSTEAFAIRDLLEAPPVSTENVSLEYNPERLMYVLYTSGSTGTPKGVMVKAHAFVNLLNWYIGEFAISESDCVLLIASISFDLAQKNLYAPLLTGGRLCIFTPGPYDYHRMSEMIEREQVTVINCAPSAFHPLIDFNEHAGFRRLRSVTRLFLGGEPINLRKLQPWTASQHFHGEIINTYGPTECTDISSSYRLTQADLERGLAVPIGKPSHNAQLYILDQELNFLPQGMVGELHIGGEGLSLGYYRAPERTAERFVERAGLPGGLVYKTGDLVRWLPDGNLEYLGRIDHQVKINGIRIETGEIEARLLEIPAIQEAVVVERKDANGMSRLAAYFTANEPMPGSEVKQALALQLPAFMIPSAFVQLDRMPLTPNGKMDRKALPEPEQAVVSVSTRVEPENERERQLVAIWQEVLGLEQIGVEDRFSDLGGHSLQAIMMISRLYKYFQVTLSLREVFQYQTIRELAHCIENAAAHDEDRLMPAAEQPSYPVSSAQQRMLIMQDLQGAGTTYNMPEGFIIDGEVDGERLRAAFARLMERHEALRTSFEWVSGEPVQRIHAQAELPFVSCEMSEEQVMQRFTSFVQPFDLSRAPLFRAELIRIGEQRHVLLLDTHHIISDGMSQTILLHDLITIYEGKDLPAPLLQYKDFAVWQNRTLSTPRMTKHEEFWLNRLTDLPVLALPTDFARPPVMEYAGEEMSFEADAELTASLRTLAAETGTTLYLVLLAAFQVLLAKYAGQEDVLVGTPVIGRYQADLEQTVGMFVNMVAMRNQPKGDKTFRAFLADVAQNALESLDHQEYPFELLVDRLNLQRDFSRNPLFDVVFALQNMTAASPDDPHSLQLQPFGGDGGTAKFDLTLQAIESGDKITFQIEYRTKLFRSDTISRMSRHFLAVLREIALHADKRLDEVNLLSEAETHQLLVTFNDSRAPYPQTTIDRLFSEVAASMPDAAALMLGEQTMSYRELDVRANRLAHALQKRGVKQGGAVGLCIERSFEMYVGMLAILKAGAVYVPIDWNYPQERIEYMIEDTQICLLLMQEKCKPHLLRDSLKALCLDSEWAEIAEENGEAPVCATTPDSPAYVMYTSGSTGKPKGVIASHRGVVRLVKGVDYADLSSGQVMAQFSTINFDASTFEIWGSLLNGARLAVFPPVAPDLQELARFLKRHQVSLLFLTTALFNQLVQDDPESLASVKQLFTGGEVMSASHAKKVLDLFPHLSLSNVYGPTEGTAFTTWHPVVEQGEEDRPVPIGRPINNTQVYVCDRHLSLVPVGVYGELLIGGDGLALGYLNLPEITQQRFVPNPFSDEPGSMLYRTGDIVRWRKDGTLEFAGRIDAQVKLRGFRIELGEIEAVLGKHPDVREQVVLLREDAVAGKSLFACAVVDPNAQVGGSDLRHYLKQNLPEYMVPAQVAILDHFPLNQNGKIDRQVLLSINSSKPHEEEGLRARDALEWKLETIWEELLGVSPVGPRDHFFDLGGHSLLAMRMIGRIKKELNLELSLGQIMQGDTVEQIATVLRQQEPQQAFSPLVPIQPKGGKRPIFFVHPVGGSIMSYLELSRELGPEQPFYGLQAQGLDDDGEPLGTVEELAASYLQAIRTIQPEGPYLLGGWSFGGVVALEMARHLQAQGQEATEVVMIDSGMPPQEPFEQEPDEAAMLAEFVYDLFGGDLQEEAGEREEQSFEERVRSIREQAVRMNILPPDLSALQVERIFRVFRANLIAFLRYRPGRYEGAVRFFRAREVQSDEPAYGWERVLAGKFERMEINGNHYTILQPPQVRTITERMFGEQ